MATRRKRWPDIYYEEAKISEDIFVKNFVLRAFDSREYHKIVNFKVSVSTLGV